MCRQSGKNINLVPQTHQMIKCQPQQNHLKQQILGTWEVSEFITCHKMKMKNKDEFFAVAHIQNEQG